MGYIKLNGSRVSSPRRRRIRQPHGRKIVKKLNSFNRAIHVASLILCVHRHSIYKHIHNGRRPHFFECESMSAKFLQTHARTHTETEEESGRQTFKEIR